MRSDNSGKALGFAKITTGLILRFPFQGRFAARRNHLICQRIAVITIAKELQGIGQIHLKTFGKSFMNPRRHAVVEIRNALAAMLVVLITLYGNASQCGITGNIIGFS